MQGLPVVASSAAGIRLCHKLQELRNVFGSILAVNRPRLPDSLVTCLETTQPGFQELPWPGNLILRRSVRREPYTVSVLLLARYLMLVSALTNVTLQICS